MENGLPVRIIRITDHFSGFRRVFNEMEEFIFIFQFLIQYFVLIFHYLVPPLPTSVIRGSMIIMSTSPRNTPTIPSVAYRITSVLYNVCCRNGWSSLPTQRTHTSYREESFNKQGTTDGGQNRLWQVLCNRNECVSQYVSCHDLVWFPDLLHRRASLM